PGSTKYTSKDVHGRLFLCLKSSKYGAFWSVGVYGDLSAATYLCAPDCTPRQRVVFFVAHQCASECLDMPPRTTRLTETKIKQANPKDKDYALGDGNGLQLRIRINGSKLWMFIYTHPFTKKRVTMGFGPYPEVSLAQARKMTLEARELAAIDKDPKEEREVTRYQQRAATEHTLEKVAEAWFDLKKESVTQPYAEDIWRSLTLHVFPNIGGTPISKLTAPMAIDLLRPLEAKGSLETVKRVSQRLNE